MPYPFTLSEAVAVYFEAKKVQLQEMPESRLLDVGPLQCIRNHPNWQDVDGFYALNVTPAEAVAAVQSYGPNAKHMITVFASSPDSLKEAYLELGYRLLPWAQPFMVKPLSESFGFDELDSVKVRQTQAMRDYWIKKDGQPVCRAASIMTSAKAIYVSGMETLPAYRRRGLASAVLRHIHHDALAGGAEQSVLCSSPMGLPLYQARGYDVMAYMQAFVPV